MMPPPPSISLLSTCIQRHELTILVLPVYMMLDTGEDELRVQQIVFWRNVDLLPRWSAFRAQIDKRLLMSGYFYHSRLRARKLESGIVVHVLVSVSGRRTRYQLGLRKLHVLDRPMVVRRGANPAKISCGESQSTHVRALQRCLPK